MRVPTASFYVIGAPRGKTKRDACPGTIFKAESEFSFQFNSKRKCLTHPDALFSLSVRNYSIVPQLPCPGVCFMWFQISSWLFFCCFDKRNKMHFMTKSMYGWAASLREAWGNFIRIAFIEFNTGNKAKKVSTEDTLPWKWSKSFLSVCLYLISLIFTWKGRLLRRKELYLQV